jgi:hypothetical protein
MWTYRGIRVFRTKIADYDKWKPVFDRDAADRQAAGSKGGQLLRDDSDPNLVYILLSGTWIRPASTGSRKAWQRICKRQGLSNRLTFSS